MKFTLAKKLKNAGFPQTCERAYYEFKFSGWQNQKGVDIFEKTPHEGDYEQYWHQADCPNISELIEACVESSDSGDFHLERNSLNSKESFTGWGASVDCFKGSKYISGATPEEAVARLWLTLHKRK